MTTYYRNEYLFSEIYIQEITQQPEDTEILASLTTLKEYREFARTATIQEWKKSFVHEALYALRFNIKIEDERLTLLYPVGNMETPLTLCYVLLPTEDLDDTAMGRNWAEKVIRSLRHHNLKWGLLTNGEQWRMYHLDESTPYEIFLEINLAAILSDSASQAYQIFHKFMKVENFTTGEQGQCRLDVFKKESLAKIDYIESELANALKQKEEGGKGVLSNLCMGYVEFLKSSGSPNFDDDALRGKIYHGAMLYMFRLLFLFYADARGLLNETNSNLLKDVLRRSNAAPANKTPAAIYSIWEDLERIFVDIDQSYNGGLFDPHESEFTQFIEESRVNDGYLASALHYLTSYQERSKEEKAISYRDMSVRHLGTLYEGLLEHKLFITKEDTEVRTVKDKIQFIPASQGGRIVAGRYVPAGQVYFGSDRTERKATGSFYTPEHIVKYIVRNTVGEKLAQLRQDFLTGQKDLLSAASKAIDKKERKALTELLEDNLKTFIKEKILKLSVLDPAMGSGHFLVNTANYVANFITEILNEFELVGTTETSTTHWRRWVVENCVYGVDVNPLAVELAKLSLWILSMSKEKPLSFLNHNLKTGNSLIGVRLDDIGKYFGKAQRKQRSIFSDDRDFKEAVNRAISNYTRITSTDSETLDVIADKKAWLDEIDEILKPYKLVCDMHTSIYFGNEISEWTYRELIDSKNSLLSNNDLPSYFHWELEYPVTFLMNFGFDVVIGNPPFVDSETMTKSAPKERVFISNQYSCAKGNWDLFIPFMQMGLMLSGRFGSVSLLSPNKWLGAPYGTELRKYTINSLEMILDFSSSRAFPGVGVAAIAAVFLKNFQKPITILRFEEANIRAERFVVSRKHLEAKENWGFLLSPYIDTLMAISSTDTSFGGFLTASDPFTVSEAYELKEDIEEYCSDSDEFFKFINTGTVDPFISLWGHYDVRYLKSKFTKPVIKKARFKERFPRRYKQANTPKLILSGMRKFEAFLDEKGQYIAGKSSIIAIPKDRSISLLTCLGILNSDLMRFFVQESFGVLGIDGGISFSGKMIEELPLPVKFNGTIPYIEKAVMAVLKDISDSRSINDSMAHLNQAVFAAYGIDLNHQKIILEADLRC